MASISTYRFIIGLSKLKSGELSLLRTHADQGLDESLQGFDIFTGIWWPLRQKNQSAPRRSVAWLICKLYAVAPLSHEKGKPLMILLSKRRPSDPDKGVRFDKRVDEMLIQSLDTIEPHLRWALREVAKLGMSLNWAQVTDDLSIWERQTTRQKWIEQYINQQ